MRGVEYLNSNPKGFLQSSQPYGSKSQFELGASTPEFEPSAKNKAINPEKGGRLKLRLINLKLQMRMLKPKIRKGEDQKQKTKQAHQPFKNFQTTSNSSTTSPLMR